MGGRGADLGGDAPQPVLSGPAQPLTDPPLGPAGERQAEPLRERAARVPLEKSES